MRLMKYLGVIGLAIFFFLVWIIGPERILANFLLLDPVIFAAALLLLIPALLIKGY